MPDQRPRQLPCDNGLRLGTVLNQLTQNLQLRLEPRPSIRGVGQRHQRDLILRRRKRNTNRVTHRNLDHRRPMSVVQVVVKQTPPRAILLLGGIGDADGIGAASIPGRNRNGISISKPRPKPPRILPKQVMHLIATGIPLVEQVLVLHPLQELLSATRRDARQSSRRHRRKVATGMPPQQSEQPTRRRRQPPIRQVENRLQQTLRRRLRIRPGLQLPSQIPQRPPRPRLQPRRGKRHRQRQAPAGPNDLLRSLRLGANTPLTDDLGQQHPRLIRREHIECQRDSALQIRQRPPARDQHQTRRRSRKQIAHLPRIGGVVEQQQSIAPVNPIPKHGSTLIQRLRDLLPRHTELTQEGFKNLVRLGRGPLGIEPTQVHIQLQIGIAPRPNQAVRGTHGELRLPHATHALDGHHIRGRRPVLHGGRRSVEQTLQLDVTAGELRQISGQLPQNTERTTGLRRTMHPNARLPPPLDRCLIRSQRTHNREHQIQIQPTTPSLEHVPDRGMRHRLRRPHQRADAPRQSPIRRVPGPAAELLQQSDELRKISSSRRIRPPAPHYSNRSNRSNRPVRPSRPNPPARPNCSNHPTRPTRLPRSNRWTRSRFSSAR
jgi:hypothetical protein